LSGALQQSARVLVSLLTTPLIVRGLGTELYGAWAMIQQATGYLALGDARPMGALKFSLATEQHLDDGEAKRRQVGAALVIWLLGLPLLLVAGLGLLNLAPSIIRVATDHIAAVRLTLALSIIALALDRLLCLPSNILRAVNLDYRAAGLNTVAILLGGAATVAAVLSGWGLVGLAAASLGAIVLAFLPRWWIMVREVPWFGVSRPTRAEVGRFVRLGGWLLLLAIGSLLLTASDLLVVGYVLGPAAAASYARTGAALRFCVEPIMLLVSAGNAGIAGLCGSGEYARVEQARREILMIGLVLFIVAGAGIVLLNRSFVSLWVGPGLYAGDLTNVLLIVTTFQLLVFRTDSIILDSLMAFKAKVAVTIAAGLLGILFGGVMAREWGLAGMAAGTILGRMVLVSSVPLIIHHYTGIRVAETMRVLGRPLALGSLLLAVAVFIAPRTLASWPALTLGAGTIVVVAGAAMVGGMEPAIRQALVARARAAVPR
jgi:O-antigen/teichoic acid export membrane protein